MFEKLFLQVLLISIRNIVLPDKIQKQGLQQVIFFFQNPGDPKTDLKIAPTSLQW